ncbi:DUF5337 domain-containing protein [Pseudoruegeria sp. SK021]|uniref:DUF5337 domain-containing protein n=1 Tax=Pseudoruegeria sp. SK021 TaxID=1933035 RepID=UPI000A254264|nr:DUF5337 domain-containing protein [Pseudoruegeria sp. SK021]OSP54502.1 hypothetical protein BV911_12270 [Pseudoruegeria sp. SK021]
MSPASPPQRDAAKATERQARTVALVIAGAMLLWLAAQFLGQHFDWPARYAFLFDFAALAAMFWSLVVTWQIWRKRRSGQATDMSEDS